MNEVCRQMSQLGFDDKDFWANTVEKIRAGFLPRLEFVDERPYVEADFISHLPVSLESLQIGFTICESSEALSLNIQERDDILKSFVVPLLLLSSENNQKSEWTTASHIELSYKIFNQLKFRIFGVSSIFEILLPPSDSDKMLRWCLEDLRPKLINSSWKQYPAARQSFTWLLHQVSIRMGFVFIQSASFKLRQEILYPHSRSSCLKATELSK